MAKHLVKVGVSKLQQLEVTVAVEADSRTGAVDAARTAVRRMLAPDSLATGLITKAQRPTYQIHEAEIVADSTGAA